MSVETMPDERLVVLFANRSELIERTSINSCRDQRSGSTQIPCGMR